MLYMWVVILMVVRLLGRLQDRYNRARIKTGTKKYLLPLIANWVSAILGFNSISMKKPSILLIGLLFTCSRLFSQQIEFRSSQSFDAAQLNDLFSSFRVSGDWILFNAPDYKLYAYSRSDKQLRWTYDLRFRSDIQPFIVNGEVWVNGNQRVARLNLATGEALQDLPLTSINTEPFIKDGRLFCTGTYNGGRIIQYDLTADSVNWSRFIAHGNAIQPFYMDNRIVANGEGSTWIEYNYSGKYLSAGCELETAWVSENPCARNFITLSHDGKEISEKLTSKLGLGETASFSLPNKTFLLCEKRLVILGDGLKPIFNKELKDLSEDLLGEYGSDLKILDANNETVWIHESDRVIQYNYRLKKTIRLTDLSQWQPHNLKMYEGKFWLVSRADGLLYCIDPTKNDATTVNR